MPKVTIKSLEAELIQAKGNWVSYKERNVFLDKALEALKIENETLKSDKRFLQNTVSQLTQAIHTRS